MVVDLNPVIRFSRNFCGSDIWERWFHSVILFSLLNSFRILVGIFPTRERFLERLPSDFESQPNETKKNGGGDNSYFCSI